VKGMTASLPSVRCCVENVGALLFQPYGPLQPVTEIPLLVVLEFTRQGIRLQKGEHSIFIAHYVVLMSMA
jgi:hypothetical protein